jgi:hypothetical protein
VEPPEPVGEIQRHDQYTRAQDKHVLGLAEIETADTADEQVADGKVEKAPQDIDCRGRQAHSGWRCKGALERMSRDPVAEMGCGVREEYSPEEVRHIVVPTHGRSVLGQNQIVAGFRWQ